jgi:hypothetical protein
MTTLRERLAKRLRRWAQRLNPEPITLTIELCQTDGPVVAHLDDLRGFPVYFWRVDERTVSFYPIPAGELRLCARYGV